MPALDRTAISHEVAKRAQMATLDLDVLDELCQTEFTRNAVILADDLIARRRLILFGDPVGLIVEVLERLNQMGWITYRLGHYEVPIHIRPTKIGYHVAGYPILYQVAHNSFRRGRVPMEDDGGIRHPGDRTDFRTHLYSAEGGPVEATSLDQHLLNYPDHLDLHADAIREIRDAERNDMASLREAILDGLFDARRPLTTNELFEAIKDQRPMGMVDVVSQTWALQKAGELTFKERKGQSTGNRGHHGGDLTDITLTPLGEHSVGKRRGIKIGAVVHDRPFVKVTMDDVLAGTGMVPIEPPKRPEVEVTDRLAYGESKADYDTRVVAGSILAEKAGGKVVEDRSMFGRTFTVKPLRSTATDGGRHPVGKDMTDPKRHGSKARGGPVTRERVSQEDLRAAADALDRALGASEAQVAASETSSSAEQADIEEKSLNGSPMRDLEFRFPTIWRTITREDKTAAAAKLLEEAGLDELALQAMEQVQFSDLEKEVIALVKELGETHLA